MRTVPPLTPAQQQRFVRLPKVGQLDPVFGLSRSFMNSLILPTRHNDFTPAVKSYVIKKPGAKTGVRLVDIQSLTDFILQHEDKGGKSQLTAALPSRG